MYFFFLSLDNLDSSMHGFMYSFPELKYMVDIFIACKLIFLFQESKCIITISLHAIIYLFSRILMQ